MLKSTNKLQIKQCKWFITYSSRGTQHRTRGSITKYNFEYITTFEQLRARSSAKVSLHNKTRFSQGMWLYSSLKYLPEMPKAWIGYSALLGNKLWSCHALELWPQHCWNKGCVNSLHLPNYYRKKWSLLPHPRVQEAPLTSQKKPAFLIKWLTFNRISIFESEDSLT